MNHYFVYHNEKRMKSTILDIGLLRGVTNNAVDGSEGGMAWVISGADSGSKTKGYYLSSFFIIKNENPSSWPYPDFENAIEGDKSAGKILNPPIEITGEHWLPALRDDTNNFYGFQKITATSAIKGLQNLVKPYMVALTRPSSGHSR